MAISVPANWHSACPNLGTVFQKRKLERCFKFVNLFAQIVQKAAISADTQSYNLCYILYNVYSH